MESKEKNAAMVEMKYISNDHALEPLPNEPPKVRFHFTFASELASIRNDSANCEPAEFLTDIAFSTLRSAKINAIDPPTIRLSVDHSTDGGKWILIGTRTTTTSNANPISVPTIPVYPLQELPAYLPLQSLGRTLGLTKIGDLSQLSQSVAGVRVFSCSLLDSENVTHIKNEDIQEISKISKHLFENPNIVLENPHLITNMKHSQSLTGNKTSHKNPNCYSTLYDKCSCILKAIHEIPKEDIKLTILWVRFQDNVVIATDPEDPSFWSGGGENLKKLKFQASRNSGGQNRKAENRNRDKKAVDDSVLEIMRQETYDEETILSMTNPNDAPTELQNFVLQQDTRDADENELDANNNLICFHCEGTGERWIAVKNTYGEEAGQLEKRRMLSRDNESYQRALSRGVTSWSRSIERSHSSDSDNTALSYDSDFNDFDQKEMKSNGKEVAVVNQTSTKDIAVMMRRSESELHDKSALIVPMLSVPRTLDKCWVCQGTGFHTIGGHQNGTIMNSNDDIDECLICWHNPQKFGVSTSCAHLFCEDCIRGHLNSILSSGNFPGYCPLCQSAAPENEQPRYGRIDGKALTFLETKGVIEKELQFRFMRKQNEDTTDSFFACPAKCGNFLIDVDPTYVLRQGIKVAVTERCPCGVGVCLQCHQEVREKEFLSHKCPEQKSNSKEDDEATMNMMKKIGKKCPNCSMFIIKNEGCDYMMCGDKAHGDLTKAIKAGGCGQAFMWSSLKKITDSCTNFEGKRDRCIAPIKYAKQIAYKKMLWGIIMSEEELSLAEEYKNMIGAKCKDIEMDRHKKKKQAHERYEKQIMWSCLEHDSHNFIDVIVQIRKLKNKRIPVDSKWWRDNEGDVHASKCSQFIFPPIFVLLLFYQIIRRVIYLCLFPRRCIFYCCFMKRCRSVNRISGYHDIPGSSITLFWSIFHCFVLAGFLYLFCLYDGWYVLLVTLLMPFVLPRAVANLWFTYTNAYNTPITLAAACGDVDIVKLLLKHHADPTDRANSEITPIIAATIFNRPKVFDVLVKHSPNVLQEDFRICSHCGIGIFQRCCCRRVTVWNATDRECKGKIIWWYSVYILIVFVQVAVYANYNHFIKLINPPTIEPIHPMPYVGPYNGTYVEWDRNDVKWDMNDVDIIYTNYIGASNVFATYTSDWPKRQALRFDSFYASDNLLNLYDTSTQKDQDTNRSIKICLETQRVYDCRKKECQHNFAVCPTNVNLKNCACPLQNLQPPPLFSICNIDDEKDNTIGTSKHVLRCIGGECLKETGLLRDSEISIGSRCHQTRNMFVPSDTYFGQCPQPFLLKSFASNMTITQCKTFCEQPIQLSAESVKLICSHFSYSLELKKCQLFSACPHTVFPSNSNWETHVRARKSMGNFPISTGCSSTIDVCPTTKEQEALLWKSGGKGKCVSPQVIPTEEGFLMSERFEKRLDAVRLLISLDLDPNVDDITYGRLCFRACGVYENPNDGTTATGCEYFPSNYSTSRTCWARTSVLQYYSNSVNPKNKNFVTRMYNQFRRRSPYQFEIQKDYKNFYDFIGVYPSNENNRKIAESSNSLKRRLLQTDKEFDLSIAFDPKEVYCWTFNNPVIVPSLTVIDMINQLTTTIDIKNSSGEAHNQNLYDKTSDAIFNMHVELPKWDMTSPPCINKIDSRLCNACLWENGGDDIGSWLGISHNGIFRLRVGKGNIKLDDPRTKKTEQHPELAVIDIVMKEHLDLFDGKFHWLKWIIRLVGRSQILLYGDDQLLGRAYFAGSPETWSGDDPGQINGINGNVPLGESADTWYKSKNLMLSYTKTSISRNCYACNYEEDKDNNEWLYSLMSLNPWSFCAMENQACICPSKIYRYGYGFIQTFETFSSKTTFFSCSNKHAGKDPFPGIVKRCECWQGEYRNPVENNTTTGIQIYGSEYPSSSNHGDRKMLHMHVGTKNNLTNLPATLTFRLSVYDLAPYEVSSIDCRGNCFCDSKDIMQKVPGCAPTCYSSTGVVKMLGFGAVNLNNHPDKCREWCPGAKFSVCAASNNQNSKGGCRATKFSPKTIQFTVNKKSSIQCIRNYFGARTSREKQIPQHHSCGWIPILQASSTSIATTPSIIIEEETVFVDSFHRKDIVSKRDMNVGCTTPNSFIFHSPIIFNNLTWSTMCESIDVDEYGGNLRTVKKRDSCIAANEQLKYLRTFPTWVGGSMDASFSDPLLKNQNLKQKWGRCTSTSKSIPNVDESDSCFGDLTPSEFWPAYRKQEGCTNKLTDNPEIRERFREKLCVPRMCQPYNGTSSLPLQCSTQKYVLNKYKTNGFVNIDYMSHRSSLTGCVILPWSAISSHKIQSQEKPSSIYFVSDYQSHRQMSKDSKILCERTSSISLGYCKQVKSIEFESKVKFRNLTTLSFYWDPPVNINIEESQVTYDIYYGASLIKSVSSLTTPKSKISIFHTAKEPTKEFSIRFVGSWINNKLLSESKKNSNKIISAWKDCHENINTILLEFPKKCMAGKNIFKNYQNSMVLLCINFGANSFTNESPFKFKAIKRDSRKVERTFDFSLACDCKELQLPWCNSQSKYNTYSHFITGVKVTHTKKIEKNAWSSSINSPDVLPKWMLLDEDGLVFSAEANVSNGSQIFASSHRHPKYNYCDGQRIESENSSLVSLSQVLNK